MAEFSAVLFGGTFDPPHLGHLEAARRLRRATGLPLWVVPVGRPGHRPPPVATGTQRREMLELALAELDDPEISILTWELERPEVSYTSDMVEHLLGQHPGLSLVLALGSDAAAALPAWHEAAELLSRVRLLVFDRLGSAARGAEVVSLLERGGFPVRGAEVVELDTPEIDASSIRGRLGRGEDCRQLLPRTVLEYLRCHPVYAG